MNFPGCVQTEVSIHTPTSTANLRAMFDTGKGSQGDQSKLAESYLKAETGKEKVAALSRAFSDAVTACTVIFGPLGMPVALSGQWAKVLGEYYTAEITTVRLTDTGDRLRKQTTSIHFDVNDHPIIETTAEFAPGAGK